MKTTFCPQRISSSYFLPCFFCKVIFRGPPTLNTLKSTRKIDISKVIFASSCMGGARDCSATIFWKPRQFLAVCKLTKEGLQPTRGGGVGASNNQGKEGESWDWPKENVLIAEEATTPVAQAVLVSTTLIACQFVKTRLLQKSKGEFFRTNSRVNFAGEILVFLGGFFLGKTGGKIPPKKPQQNTNQNWRASRPKSTLQESGLVNLGTKKAGLIEEQGILEWLVVMRRYSFWQG